MMLPRIIFSGQYPIPSQDLPLTLISLEEWTLVKLYGQDVIQYLHDQLTCDIKNLDKHKHSFAAHCNPKGKMLSNMYVFHLNNQEMGFIERRNVCEKQIFEMKKYMVFSNVTIAPDYNAILIGIAGINARNYLSTLFSVLPNKTHTIVHDEEITFLHLNSPTERFLLIINKKSTLDRLLIKLQPYIQFNDSRQWTLLDIEAGYPIIEPITSEVFIPQAVNMDTLQGISFDKGCYIGQESIARIQYRGRNKQALFRLIGTIIDDKHDIKLPSAGDQVELKINNQYWKNIGIVLKSCQIKKNNIWMQVVLNRSVLKSSELRITNIQTNHSFIFIVIDT